MKIEAKVNGEMEINMIYSCKVHNALVRPYPMALTAYLQQMCGCMEAPLSVWI